MIKLFYALKPELLEGYKQAKDDLLKARSEMSEQSISEAKEEIVKECNVYDYDSESTEDLYTVNNGIANIPIAGMLTTKVDVCSAFFGETVTTYRFIQEAVKAAEEDPQVEKILFHANSGGGYVEGCEITSQVIAGCKKKKYAAVYDMAASACYWLISQCDEIISVSRSGFVGSIGVAAEIINRDKQNENHGIKRTTVTNTESKDKRPDLSTDEGLQVFIDELNSVYRVFTSTILKKREGKLTQKKIDDLSGKVLIAEQALDYGLVDRFMEVSELNNYVKSSNSNLMTGNSQSVAKADKPVRLVAEYKPTPSTGNNSEGRMETLKDFLAQNPDAKARYEADLLSARLEGEEAGKAEMQKRIDATVPYIGNENYAGIEPLAKEVLRGEADVSSLKGAVAAFDMVSEKKKSDAAAEETEVLGETVPDNGVSKDDVKNAQANEEMKKAARYS